MTTHRAFHEIIFTILTLCSRQSARRTFIMYHANLSWYMLGVYLDYMQEHELIAKTLDDESMKEVITITDKGFQFIKLFKQIHKVLGISEIEA